MRERDLKPGDASAMAQAFAIFHAATVITTVGAEMPFRGDRKRTVNAVFKDAGLYRGGRLTARGRRCQQLAIDEFNRRMARKRRKAK